VAPLASDTPIEWIIALRKQGSISIPAKERDEFLATLLCCPNLPPLRLPEELRYEEVALPPHPRLTISKARVLYRHGRLDAKLCFAYEGRAFAAFDPREAFSMLQDGVLYAGIPMQRRPPARFSISLA